MLVREMYKIKRESGVTLVELIVTVIIIAIIAAIAMPMFGNLVERERMQTDAYHIFSAMQDAQEVAVLSNRPVIMLPVGDYSYGNSDEAVQKYWFGNEIITAYIPEDLYETANLSTGSVASFIDELKERYRTEEGEGLVLRKERLITFAEPDDASFGKVSAMAFSSHPDFRNLQERAIVITASGHFVNSLSVVFYRELANQQQGGQTPLALAGLCFEEGGIINNFIPAFITDPNKIVNKGSSEYRCDIRGE